RRRIPCLPPCSASRNPPTFLPDSPDDFRERASASQSRENPMSFDEIAPEGIEKELASHFADCFGDATQRAFSQDFRRNGYVKLPDFASRDLFPNATKASHRLLDLHQQRIDIHLKETGNSPRFMSTVSQKAIEQDSELVRTIYNSEAMM